MEGGGEEEAQRGREDEALGETAGERQGPCQRGTKNQGVHGNTVTCSQRPRLLPFYLLSH